MNARSCSSKPQNPAIRKTAADAIGFKLEQTEAGAVCADERVQFVRSFAAKQGVPANGQMQPVG